MASINPRAVAQQMLSQNSIRGGFNKVTKEVCLALAKGTYDYVYARELLNMRLTHEFKNNAKNMKKVNICITNLYNFNLFLVSERLKCIQNYSKLNISLGDDQFIIGQGCAIFKDIEDSFCGVILTDKEFDFGNTLRIPIEQYWIAKKMKLSDTKNVRIYIYHLIENSYQTIQYAKERIDLVLIQSRKVLENVEIELKKIS
ncbi:hypothetical protein [Sphingobacterium hungaricum]